MKDMTSAATSMMTEEEKAEVEKQMNAGNPNLAAAGLVSSTEAKTTPAVDSTTHETATGPSSEAEKRPAAIQGTDAPSAAPNGSEAKEHTSASHPVAPAPAPPTSTSTSAAKTATEKEHERQEAARRKAEQREKLREQEKARRKVMEERVAMLTQKMKERLRPFVEAKNPGVEGDPESIAFSEKMKREVEDLKLESFGVEVCYDFS